MAVLSFADNVIAQAEFRHQRYVIQTSRSGRAWIALAVVMLLPGLLTSLVTVALAVFQFDATEDTFFNEGIPFLLAQLGAASLVVMNIALYIVLMLITLGLAAQSITREKTNRTWDVLLLTNVDARQMVLGKWWASLVALWGDHMMLFVVRMGVIGLIMTSDPFDFNLPYLVVMGVSLFAFTVMDAALTIALAIASSLAGVVASVAVPVVLMFRFVMMLVAMIGFPVFTLIMYNASFLSFIAVGITVLLAMVAITWGALAVAQTLAVRGDQVSPAAATPSTA